MLRALALPPIRRRRREIERVIKFAVDQKTRVDGDLRAVDCGLQNAEKLDPQSFSLCSGSVNDGKNQLTAAMRAAFLYGRADITPSVIKNQAAYISGWLGVLKKDSRMLIAAGGAAQLAADHILAQPSGLRELGPDEHESAAAEGQNEPTVGG